MKQEEGAVAPEVLLNIIDNLTRNYQMPPNDYILLIKRQPHKDYCTLFLTNCHSSFWFKKINRPLLTELRDRLKINSELPAFTQHLATGLEKHSNIVMRGDEAVIDVELSIGDGLVMSIKIEMTDQIKISESQKDFTTMLKIFLKQLYEAKEAQINKAKQKWSKVVKQEESQKGYHPKQPQDPNYLAQVLQIPQKKNAVIDNKPKNRSLMNPNQKRRKHGGIQFKGQDQ